MKALNKLFVLCVVMLSISACSTITTNQLLDEESSALTDKKLIVSKYSEKPNFLAQTAANVQFGMLGMAKAISSGNSMIENNDIEDPAVEISHQLADYLKISYDINVVDGASLSTNSSEIDDLVNKYGNSDFILDVRTLGWSSLYYVSDFNNYKVSYSAHVRIINTHTKAVIAEEVCSSIPEYDDTNQAPSYDDLENGVGLRKELERSIEFCVNHIKTKVIDSQENPES